jgi:hypothetical protein
MPDAELLRYGIGQISVGDQIEMIGQNIIISQRPTFAQAVLRKRTYRTARAVLKDQAGDRL